MLTLRDIYHPESGYSPTPQEELFRTRLNSAEEGRAPHLAKWMKIEARLYNKGWENEKLLTKQGNLLLEALNWTLSEYNTDAFVPEINPIAHQDIVDIDKYDKVIKSEWKRLRIPEKNLDIIRDTLIYGIGVQRVRYDPLEKFDDKVSGVIRTERIDPRHFYFDPRVSEFADADFVFLKKEISMLALFQHDKVRNDPDLQKKILANWLVINQGSSNSQRYLDYMLARKYDKMLDEIQNNIISFYSYYYREVDNSGATPKVVYHHAIMVGDQQPLQIDDVVLSIPFFPFAVCWQNKYPNSLYGVPFLEKAYFSQHALDNYDEATIRILKTQKYPILLKPKAADIQKKDLTHISSELLSGEEFIKVVEYPATVTPDQFKFLDVNEAFRGIQEIAMQKALQAKEDLNLTGINTSSNLGSLTTTGGVQSAQQQAAKYYRHAKTEIARYCRKLIKIILYMISAYYTEKRSFTYYLHELGIDFQKNKQQEIVPTVKTFPFKGSVIKMDKIKWNIKIDALTRSEADKQSNNLLQLFQISRQYQENPNNTVNELDIIEALDLPNKQKILHRAAMNQYQNKLAASEQIIAIVRHSVLLEIMYVFKELGKQTSDIIRSPEDAEKLANVILEFMQFRGDFSKIWNSNERVNMGDIVRQITTLTYLDDKK